VCFEERGIASIRLESCIGYISSKRDDSNDEIDHNIEHHFGLDRGWESSVDLHAGFHDQNAQQHVQDISNTRAYMLVSTK
jgi:hypothetical protein